MMIYEPAVLAERAVTANATRPATAIVHDAPGGRVVVFRIEAGQQVAPHTSRSTVILSIVAGSGVVSGNDGERTVRAGDLIAYEPNERHGMRAVDEPLVLLAIIAPRPGTVE
jgi:quercetin dioxygenase-like cupin family protein